MSATNRGAVRVASDFYPTDPRITADFLRRCPLPPGIWWEPACGDGAIVRAVEMWRPGKQEWSVCDVRQDAVDHTVCLAPGTVGVTDDFPEGLAARRFRGPAAVILTNPPFSLAEAFAVEALRWAAPWTTTALLLRVGIIGSRERIDFWKAHPADMYPIVPRPSFGNNKAGKPGTDASEYAWFVWGPTSTGRIHYADRPWRERGEPMRLVEGA